MLASLCALLLSVSNPIKFSGWVVFYDNGESLASFEQHAGQMSSVSIEAILCNRKGELSLRSTPTPEQLRRVTTAAKKNKVQLLAMASNADADGFGPQGVEVAIRDDASIRRHVDTLCAFVDQLGVDGLDLDYESLLGSDRLTFGRFVTALGDELHRRKKVLAIAVGAKQSEPGTWDGPISQDYAVIGKAVDNVRIMAYDQSWETSPAGPIASPDWVEKCLSFAATEIPPEKLDMGVPAYGYDWIGKKGTSITWATFSQLVKDHGTPERDPISHELVLKFDDHTVGFADGEAESPKFDICKRLHLHGVALWRLGAEDSKIWDVYQSKRAN